MRVLLAVSTNFTDNPRTFLMENIYLQFVDRVYNKIVGIPISTNCAPLITDLFLYFHEKDFMSNLHK